ncbi:MAG: divalent metal cation transporter [Gemmatimonadetes bacterium]|nr:divalent metal cation transporter [Gemmatimonadota bacterium]
MPALEVLSQGQSPGSHTRGTNIMTLPAGFWKAFGPGLMWAAAAIGVSHLVQSTRAGAMAGFGLSGIIILALVLKYPFFAFGPQYAAATGRSLVEGYRRIGSWALWLYFLMQLVTGVIHQVAILLLMAYLIQLAFGIDSPVWVIGGLLYAGCATWLAVGRFRGLDYAIKLVVAVLAVSTLIAAAIAAPRADFSSLSLWPGAATAVPLGFFLALVGFMPAPIEMSVMSSLWTLEKERLHKRRTSVALAGLDFKIGYVGTGVLALAFLLLGAAVLQGSGEQFSAAGAVFSGQLVDLYTNAFGEATRPLVLVAVLTTVFSTTLIVIDGFPRAIDRCVKNLGGREEPRHDAPIGRSYWVTVIAFGVLNVIGLSLFTSSLTPMIDFATIFTFATAPVLGYLNVRVITSDDMPRELQPRAGMLILAYVGLLALSGTTVVYLISRVAG